MIIVFIIIVVAVAVRVRVVLPKLRLSVNPGRVEASRRFVDVLGGVVLQVPLHLLPGRLRRPGYLSLEIYLYRKTDTHTYIYIYRYIYIHGVGDRQRDGGQRETEMKYMKEHFIMGKIDYGLNRESERK